MVNNVNAYNRADRILGAVFLLFLGALVLRHYYPGIFWVKAIFVGMEAALVGGIADWFAVTALFRRPLGFPWHTALIPNNRLKIIEATAHMVQHEFFSPEKLKDRLRQVRLSQLVTNWVEQHGKQLFAAMAARHIGDMLKNVDPKLVAETLEKLLKMSARPVKAAPAVHALANWALAEGKDAQFLDSLLPQITEKAKSAATRQAIYDYLLKYKEQKTEGVLGALVGWLGKKTNIINLDDAADAFQEELISLLTQLAAPSHPLRTWLHQRLEEAAAAISTDPEVGKAIEACKTEVINRLNLQDCFMDLVNTLVGEAQNPGAQVNISPAAQNGAAAQSPLLVWIMSVLDKYLVSFREDQDLQNRLEGYLQEAVHRIIDSEHDLIGAIVTDAMQILSDEELNRLIESKTGEDLQWIRINGSLVGGAAGLLIFLLIQAVQGPAWTLFP